MIKLITISAFLSKKGDIPLIDVRSPSEFMQGHIPKAINIPLFSNAERAVVGTTYKKVSKQAAIDLGYIIVKPKLNSFIEESAKAAPNKIIAVHCWRGGMRSQSFAQHLHENGFDTVYVIEKGYKAFRNFALSFFEQEFNLKILGGYTGSGKTDVLHVLKNRGEQVVDLEGIANHKGSAFGAIGEKEQPTSEQFQNNLFNELYKLNIQNAIWVEDESSGIGRTVIPQPFFIQMRSQTVYFLDIDVAERAKYLLTTYGLFDKDKLKESIIKIQKRLGFDNAKLAIEAIDSGDLGKVARISLKYYDKFYLRGLSKRTSSKIIKIPLNAVNADESANALLKH